jgi:hypothetical protein
VASGLQRLKNQANKRFPRLRDYRWTLQRACYLPERTLRGPSPDPGELYPRLQAFGKKVHSQNDEDGIIEYLFSRIPKRQSFFVEIGVGPAFRGARALSGNEAELECNCLVLAERGWRGVFVDGGSTSPTVDVKHEFVTAENINEILEKYSVPEDFDLFSLDIDGNDYWVWEALDRRPSVVIVEYNASIAASESKTIVYDPTFSWSAHGATEYHGASLLALTRLGERKGYKLVYANGTNAFFVLADLFTNHDDFVYERLYVRRERFSPKRSGDIWQEI